jgi:hypothetical protein
MSGRVNRIGRIKIRPIVPLREVERASDQV